MKFFDGDGELSVFRHRQYNAFVIIYHETLENRRNFPFIGYIAVFFCVFRVFRGGC